MRKISIAVMITCFIITASLPASVSGKSTRKNIIFRHHADIVGSVQCESGEPLSRALVYLVGESYMARTGDEGGFRLQSVRPGNYEMEIETEEIIHGPISVEVYKKREVDLGIIELDCVYPQSEPVPEPAPEPLPEPTVACLVAADCAADEYCAKGNNSCGSVGLCTPAPSDCSTEYSPVCGCDWIPYDNECLAKQSGVSVRQYGGCVYY